MSAAQIPQDGTLVLVGDTHFVSAVSEMKHVDNSQAAPLGIQGPYHSMPCMLSITYFELDPVLSRKPVKITQNWSYVIEFPAQGYNTCCMVLTTL